MKRVALSLLGAVALFSSASHAQIITLGTRFGVGAAHASMPGAFSRAGVTMGGSLGVGFLGGALGFEFEALYTQEGSGRLGTGTPFNPGFQALSQASLLASRFDYFEVPLLVKLAPPIPGLHRVRPIAMLGWAPALQLACGGTMVRGYGTPLATMAALDCDSYSIEGTDWNTIAAGGIEVATRHGILSAEFRSTRGHRDLAAGYGVGCCVYNRAWSVLVGASLRLSALKSRGFPAFRDERSARPLGRL